MSFVDDIQLEVAAGKGGDGMVHFRREKFVPKGGPDGGDGGDGGSVIVEASVSYQTMADLASVHKIKAEPGKNGGPQRKSGHGGKDAVIHVPLGTQVLETATGELLADLVTAGERAVVAKGGKGGRGNWHFRSATNQTPEQFEPGTAGESRTISLKLKLLADIGLIGLPNAGKSSLLNRLAGTGAKVGAYPFTTINPNLGILRGSDRDVILADIPGLIEGASAGKGLGHRFLQHVERCRVLVHCVAADSADPKGDYETVRQELAQYSPQLINKEEIIVITKSDLVSLDTLAEVSATMESFLGYTPVATSAATGQNVAELGQQLLGATAS